MNTAKTSMVTLCAALLLACGEQEPGASGGLPIPTAMPDPGSGPAVVSVSPANGETGIEPTTEVVIVFSEPIDPESAAPVIVRDGTAIEAEVEFLGATVVLRPEMPLALRETYQVSVPSTMSDLAGNALGQATELSFTVRDGAWAAAALDRVASSMVQTVRTAAIGVTGETIAAWSDAEGLYASRTIGSGWAPPQVLTSAAVDAVVVAGSDAGGVVAWSETNADGFSHVFAAHFTIAGGFTAAEKIDTGSHALSPVVDIDETGAVTMAWFETTWMSGSLLLARRYVPGQGWGDEAVVYSGPEFAAAPTLVAVGGEVALAWTQDDGTASVIWTSRFSAGAWGSASRLSHPSAWAFSPRIAAEGSTVAVAWNELEGYGVVVVVSASNGAGWNATRLGSTDAYAEAPRLAVGDAGALVVLWASWGATAEILSAHADGTHAFGAIVRLDASATGLSPELNGRDGHVLATWEESTGGQIRIVARVMHEEWSESIDLGEGAAPYVAATDGGRAVTMWIAGADVRYARFE